MDVILTIGDFCRLLLFFQKLLQWILWNLWHRIILALLMSLNANPSFHKECMENWHPFMINIRVFVLLVFSFFAGNCLISYEKSYFHPKWLLFFEFSYHYKQIQPMKIYHRGQWWTIILCFIFLAIFWDVRWLAQHWLSSQISYSAYLPRESDEEINTW